jgi:flagellar protein FlbD
LIILSRLSGDQIALNIDLIERVETTPDTVVTMVQGTKHVVAEPMDEVINRVRQFKASVLALSQRGIEGTSGRDGLRLVRSSEETDDPQGEGDHR